MVDFRRGLAGLLLWLLLLPVGAAEQGLLWQISGNGVTGYLFGTMHSDDPRVTRLPAEVERYFAKADTLMLEVPLDEGSEMAAAAQALLPPTTSLSAELGETMAGRAVQAMLARGVPVESSERMQPWAIALSLSMPPPVTGLFLDKLLYQRAQQEGKGFASLESINEQLSVFTGLSREEQGSLLHDVLENLPNYPVQYEKLLAAYLDRDLEQLMALSIADLIAGDSALSQKLRTRMLVRRNLRMVERMVQQLERGRIFVAVGALHLPGEQGLLTLLRQRGYQLQVLY